MCVFRFAATGNGTEVVKRLPANLRVRLGAVAAHALAPFGTADALVVAADAVAPVGLHTGATHRGFDATHRGFDATHSCFALHPTTGFLPFRPIAAGPAMPGCGWLHAPPMQPHYPVANAGVAVRRTVPTSGHAQRCAILHGLNPSLR